MTAPTAIAASLLRWTDAYNRARNANDLQACAQAFAEAAGQEAAIAAAPPSMAKAHASLTIAHTMMRDECEGGDLPSYADFITATLQTIATLETLCAAVNDNVETAQPFFPAAIRAALNRLSKDSAKTIAG